VQASVIIHRAPWVLPIRHPAISDGAVAVRSGRIAAVGRFNHVLSTFPDSRVVEYQDSVLLPALVNAHTHLELSHLAHLSRQPSPATFTGWIENMLAERERIGSAGEVVRAAALEALAAQQADGVIAIGDISNTGLTRELAAQFNGQLLCFKEYLGLRAAGVAPALELLEAEEDDDYCTAHAPYSTHADLLRALKKRADRSGHVFPIHVAEPAAESEMMSRGRGEIPDFLERRGFWDGSFQATGINNSGSVQYLHQLGILDNRTLCVHCIHLSSRELDLVKEAGCKVCICPGSNRYLGVGKAPVAEYLRMGILPALGTDSLASNPQISLWREMRLLAEDHPGVAPADILAMATAGGAAGLGLEVELGSLEAGKQARFLVVQLPEPVRCPTAVYEYLVTRGNLVQAQWILS